jgi:Bacterial Ig-like domain (group 2)
MNIRTLTNIRSRITLHRQRRRTLHRTARTRSSALHRWACTLLPALAALIALPLLVACGGGTSASGVVASTERETPLAMSPNKLDTDLDESFVAEVDALFDWAQRQYPSLYPGTPTTDRTTYQGQEFLFRSYGSTGRYLGVSFDHSDSFGTSGSSTPPPTDRVVYTLGGTFGDVLGGTVDTGLVDLGRLSDFRCRINFPRCVNQPFIERVHVEMPVTQLVAGGTQRVGATLWALDGAGQAVQGNRVQWTSDNPQVARVTASGQVQGLSVGQTRITGIVFDHSASVTVNVVAPQSDAPSAEIEALLNWAERRYGGSSNGALFPGTASTRRVTLDGLDYWARSYPGTGNTIGISLGNDHGLDGNIVYGQGPFTGGQLQDFGRLQDYRCRVDPESCLSQRAPRNLYIVIPEIVRWNVNHLRGWARALTYDDQGTLLVGQAVSWTSSDTSIATVSPSGAVRGWRSGEVVITARTQSLTASQTLRVP